MRPQGNRSMEAIGCLVTDFERDQTSVPKSMNEIACWSPPSPASSFRTPIQSGGISHIAMPAPPSTPNTKVIMPKIIFAPFFRFRLIIGFRLRRRFDITRVCVVADRGMISAETIASISPIWPPCRPAAGSSPSPALCA